MIDARIKKGATVVDYIKNTPPWAQKILKELRKVIKASAPSIKESISYQMPYYSDNGRVAYLGAFKNHCSFFWISAEDKKVFAKELAGQKVVGSTLYIMEGQAVPVMLIKKIVQSRVKSNKAKKAGKK